MNSRDYVKKLSVNGKTYGYFDINQLSFEGFADIARLPFCIKILVENLLRKLDGRVVMLEDLAAIANWRPTYETPVEIPFHPARVLMQDFTGVPAVVDLAAMRDAVEELGGDPRKINPLVPTELVVDHSVQVDYHGTVDSSQKNVAREYERNGERYQLLKWAQKSFDNFKVVPPNSGICHQVNLEYLGRVVIRQETADGAMAYPDTLVGTDSHTTMINGIGVLGWGVGGIEAEAVMLGEPYYMSIPEVIGVKLSGKLGRGVTATDLVLTITELLRSHGVVEKFVEYFGPGLRDLSLPDRATVSNMTPEYGATLGIFPVDEKTIDYLAMTNRPRRARLTQAYAKAAGLFYTGDSDPEYTEVVEIDLSTVTPSLAGPARPQERIPLSGMRVSCDEILGSASGRDAETQSSSTIGDESGCPTKQGPKSGPHTRRQFPIAIDGRPTSIGDGSVVVAAITSCTNTSNPHVLIGAGLLARNAAAKGLSVPPFVKTSLAPGSRVVIDYLQDAGLMPSLEALGFHLAAFGCTTCIGNSGPLEAVIETAIVENDLNVAAVLSGNRNFEARIHQNIKSNFLASPMLVVAFALAGRVDSDLNVEPLGIGGDGEPVFLADIWPADEEIAALVARHVRREFYASQYARIFDGDEFWRGLEITESTTYAWDPRSTYIKKPPYFDHFKPAIAAPSRVEKARPLLVLGDSVTTDHISPASTIPHDYPAGRYLMSQGVEPAGFNSYGARRGNHEVMIRGTFGNIRIKNQMVGTKEGAFTIKQPQGEEMFNYDAAMRYMDEKTPLVVIGGKEYGTGSSRDWAAKGTNLLGVAAVITRSYERIHRNNLVGMGVLPLVFEAGDSAEKLGLTGEEVYSIEGIANMRPRKTISVTALKKDGTQIKFNTIARLDTQVDVDYFEHGGILPYVLRGLMRERA